MEPQPTSAEVQPRDAGRTAIDCYLATFSAIGQTLAEVCPHIGTGFHNSLIRVRDRVAFDPSDKALVESLRAFEEDLCNFSRRASEYYVRKSNDVAAVLDLITRATEAFESRDHLYLERLSLVARQLEQGLQSISEEEMRRVYGQQLLHVRSFLDRLTADSQAVFDKIRGEIGALEDNLLRAEAEASIDAVTCLANRREMMRLTRERISAGKKFSLLLFDIRSLRTINERFGQAAGDQVLKQFGARLSAQVRPRDIVARWGGDEFAVIFDCPATEAEARARQIAEWISGRYPVTADDREWKPEIEASVAVVESRPGETEAAFATRAGSSLPQTKPRPQSAADEESSEFVLAQWPST